LSPTNVVRHRALYFVLRHFEKPIWTRTVSTYRTQGSQILVYNKEEVLAIYEQANFLDSRVNAYTDYTGFGGINKQRPNFIFTDLDLSCFDSMIALDRTQQISTDFRIGSK
jgi:hypothetical protein